MSKNLNLCKCLRVDIFVYHSVILFISKLGSVVVMISDEFHTLEISEQPPEGAQEVGLAHPAEAAAPQSAGSKSLLFAVDKLLKSKKSKSEEPSSKPSDNSSAQ